VAWGARCARCPWRPGHGHCHWHAESAHLAASGHVHPVHSCTGGCHCCASVSSRCIERPGDDLGAWVQLVWSDVEVRFKKVFLHQTLPGSAEQLAWSLKLNFCVRSTLRKD